jgi:hypothetical protein
MLRMHRAYRLGVQTRHPAHENPTARGETQVQYGIKRGGPLLAPLLLTQELMPELEVGQKMPNDNAHQGDVLKTRTMPQRSLTGKGESNK